MDAEWVAHLQSVQWRAGPVLEIHGWCYLRGAASPDRARVTVEVRDPETGRVTGFKARSRVDPVVNHAAGDLVDHSPAAFEARIDPRRCLAPGQPPQKASVRLQVSVVVTSRAGALEGLFTTRNSGGSAGTLLAMPVRGGLHVLPRWSAEDGLSLQVQQHLAVGTRFDVTPGHGQVELVTRRGFAPVRAYLGSAGAEPLASALRPAGPDRWIIELPTAMVESGDEQEWDLLVADEQGRSRRVRWGGPPGLRGALGQSWWLESRRNATLVVRRRPAALAILDLAHRPDPEAVLEVRGQLQGPAMAVESVHLSSRRVTVPAVDVAIDPDGSLRARFVLAAPSWGSAPRPLPSGRYQLMLRSRSGAEVETHVALTCRGNFDAVQHTARYNLRATRTADQLALEVTAPLAPDEIGTFHQSRLRSECASADADLRGTYLECWHGRTVADNPLAIFRELAGRGAGAPYTWGVQDLSIEVPEPARAVVVSSREWWLSMARAQYLVINFWQRAEMVKREGQVLVQTWHGTPLKLLGLDRPTKAGRPASIAVIERDTGQWDHLVSQNPHSSEVYRRAYLWDRPILEVGYPRNDVLARSSPEARRAARELIGVPQSVTTILYAPTWREDDRSKLGVLDLPVVAEELGAAFRILVRGHSITLRPGRSLHADGLVDVTTYPEVADLMLAADMLVTDYSSIMFDFSVTGRPTLFYVPDWDAYADTAPRGEPSGEPGAAAAARGVYFDLRGVAPGPVLEDEQDLIEAIRTCRAWEPRYAEAYSRWRARFNPWDDGHASQRVVDAVWGPPAS